MSVPLVNLGYAVPDQRDPSFISVFCTLDPLLPAPPPEELLDYSDMGKFYEYCTAFVEE